MEAINLQKYKVVTPIKLSEKPTYEDFSASKKELKKELKAVRKELSALQDKMYAHGKYSVLICLQGMDTAGKDSLIREVFKEFNTRGIVVHSFKVPSTKEKKHDYLWRHYIALPERGKFGIFNRTHYENVLVTRVHPEYVLGENIPGIETVTDISENFWNMRFDQINNFEKHIAKNGTLVLKFFLHLSKEEQRDRLLRRIDLKEKNWKFSPSDLSEREHWDAYQNCYEDAVNNTSKAHAPWYVIPADHKKAARLLVAKIILDKIAAHKDIQEPELEPEVLENLTYYKQQLEAES